MTDVRSTGAGSRLKRLGSAAAVLLFTATIAHAVDITNCNQTVPAGATGVLVADLDCSLGYGSYAVTLSKSARLQLNGFALRSNANGIHCLGSCRITGPGEVARTEPSCTSESSIDTYGVFGDGTVKLDRVTLTSWGYATWASSRLRAQRVHVSGQCLGLVGNDARIVVRGSTITDNFGLGVAGVGPVTVIDSTVTGNFIDVMAGRRPRIRTSTCETSGGGAGSPPDTWGICSNP